MCSAMNLALSCPNGKEALQLLVESERIQGDLNEAVADNIPLSVRGWLQAESPSLTLPAHSSSCANTVPSTWSSSFAAS